MFSPRLSSSQLSRPEIAGSLQGKADRIQIANIERDPLPFADCEVHLFIANQVLEHTKERFWIFHEVSRALKIRGPFFIWKPNICSLHNRFLLLIGRQPTQHKVCSAHVRPFSKRDTLAFLNACFPGGHELTQLRGPSLSLSARSGAHARERLSNFCLHYFFPAPKNEEYHAEFATYPARAQLETNFGPEYRHRVSILARGKSP